MMNGSYNGSSASTSSSNRYNGQNFAQAAQESNGNGGSSFAQQQQQSNGAMTNGKIYVSNMPSDCDERKLTEIFGRYGEIICITHKGSYAFIEYTEPNMATDAIMEMQAQGT